MKKKKNTLFIFSFCIAVAGCFYFLSPNLILRIAMRPMFYEWVGASNTAWGEILPMRDSFGAWIYFDYQLNICVVVVEKKWLMDSPLYKATAKASEFQVGQNDFRVTINDHDKLIFFAPNANSEFALPHNQVKTMQNECLNALDQPKAEPFQILDVVKKVYDGPDRARLLEAIEALNVQRK